MHIPTPFNAGIAPNTQLSHSRDAVQSTAAARSSSAEHLPRLAARVLLNSLEKCHSCHLNAFHNATAGRFAEERSKLAAVASLVSIVIVRVYEDK